MPSRRTAGSPGLFYTHYDSPVGRLLLAGDAASLHFISFPAGHKAFGPDPTWVEADRPFAEAKAQLAAYFAGRRQHFELPLTLTGTAFQKRVWQVLQTIPLGETRSYGWLAKTIGAPKASRAVGAANGANPLPIVVPCHRVVGAKGALTGFGGGIETKSFLLEHEKGQLSTEG
ncbi:MAG: methylated-DNA--[protein]-cysteine S-methyltransferase [Rhodospirillales bacterium]